jgi:hypothetical protein
MKWSRRVIAQFRREAMIRIVLLSLLFFAAAGSVPASTLDNPDGVVYGPCYGSIASESDCPPHYEAQLFSPLEDILPPVREDGCTLVPWEGGKWGYDYFVYGSQNGVGSGQDFDFDPVTGYLFAAFDTYHNTNDSVIVYRSTDNGANWAYWRSSYNPSGRMDNARIRVITTGGDTWVCCMFRTDDSSSNTLWMRRWRIDGTGSTWEKIADDVTCGDMDADIGTSGYLYATWVPSGTYDVYSVRNALAGAGWVDATAIFGDAQTNPQPAIAAGTGGVVSIAFIDNRLTTNEQVRIRRSTDHGFAWSTSWQVSNNTNASDLSYPDIAHARGTSAWITVTFEKTEKTLALYTSTNSGVNWTYGGVFPGSGEEYAGSLRAGKYDAGDVTLAYNVAPGGIVNFTWSIASVPTSFPPPIQINDQPAVTWSPTAGWNGTESSILYTRTGSYSLWLDRYLHIGIDDGPASGHPGLGISPNPFMGEASITFFLESGGVPVDVCIYDLSGRLVATLADGAMPASGAHRLTWNGTDASGAPVPGGVYVCRLTTPVSAESARMVLVR